MFTPWNACPVKCLFLFHWDSMLHAPCAMLAIPLGFGDSLSRYPIKLHQLTTRVELFYFVCRMKLVLRLDVGRWSRILRVQNNCQESRFDPRFKKTEITGAEKEAKRRPCWCGRCGQAKKVDFFARRGVFFLDLPFNG